MLRYETMKEMDERKKDTEKENYRNIEKRERERVRKRERGGREEPGPFTMTWRRQ